MSSRREIKISKEFLKKENLVENLNSFKEIQSYTENESPSKSKSRVLKNLESALSPKYIEINKSSDGQKRSRYGREQKYKENEGFLPTDAVCSYKRHSKPPKSDIKLNSRIIKIKPLRRSAPDKYFDSPIQKLIEKNRELASIKKSDISGEFRDNSIIKIKRTLFSNNNSFSDEIILSPPSPITNNINVEQNQKTIPTKLININKLSLDTKKSFENLKLKREIPENAKNTEVLKNKKFKTEILENKQKPEVLEKIKPESKILENTKEPEALKNLKSKTEILENTKKNEVFENIKSKSEILENTRKMKDFKNVYVFIRKTKIQENAKKTEDLENIKSKTEILENAKKTESLKNQKSKTEIKENTKKTEVLENINSKTEILENAKKTEGLENQKSKIEIKENTKETEVLENINSKTEILENTKKTEGFKNLKSKTEIKESPKKTEILENIKSKTEILENTSKTEASDNIKSRTEILENATKTGGLKNLTSKTKIEENTKKTEVLENINSKTEILENAKKTEGFKNQKPKTEIKESPKKTEILENLKCKTEILENTRKTKASDNIKSKTEILDNATKTGGLKNIISKTKIEENTKKTEVLENIKSKTEILENTRKTKASDNIKSKTETPENTKPKLEILERIKWKSENLEKAKSKKKSELVKAEKLFVEPKSSDIEHKTSSIDYNNDKDVYAAKNIQYEKGDVCWSRIGTFPYWPCMVYPDKKGIIYADYGFPGQGNIMKVHIKYFADKGRRSWVNIASTLPYNGLEDFLEIKNQVNVSVAETNKTNKKKLLKPFTVLASQEQKWYSAIKEADEILKSPLINRIDAFDKILNETLKQQQKARNVRKKSMLKNLIESKRLRSPTPESPAYEPILPMKKMKFSDSILIQQDSDSNKNTIGSFDHNNSNINPYLISEFASTIGNNLAFSFLLNNDDTATKLFLTNNEVLNNNTKLILNKSSNSDVEESNNFFTKFKAKHFNSEDMEDVEIAQLRNYTEKLKSLKNFLNITENVVEVESTNRNVSPEKTSDITIIKLEELSKTDDSIDIKIETPSELSLSILDTPSSSLSTSSLSLSPVISEPDTNMSEFSKYYLFRKLTKEATCRLCHQPSNLLKCEGPCHGWFHYECVNDVVTDEIQLTEMTLNEFKCTDCGVKRKPACFVCKSYSEDPQILMRCKYNACGRYYHKGCLKYFPQAKIIETISLICPTHSCHTCISDDPRVLISDKSSFVKCVECPSTYHMDSTCIPAGSQFITATQIICPKHRENIKQINANWCFICTEGGRLVCCETCPTAFHIECLNLNIPEEKGYICEECETGRLPLYGEIVWAKLGNYRWWPAQIIPPPAIPENVLKLNRPASDFCVKFFGTNNFSWINRGRVYLYQEGDWGKAKNRNSLEVKYEQAILEARELYVKLKEQKILRRGDKKLIMIPRPYIKIKSNKPVYPVKLMDLDVNDLLPCNCDPKENDPCGPNSGCINRLLLFECNPKICPAGSNCLNQMFEKHIYPRLKVVHTDLRGWGLVVLENIKMGSFVVEYVGEIIDTNEFRRRLQKMKNEKDENYYFLTLTNSLLIDAGPKGNVARFINHSCEPNCETQKWTVNGITRIGLFARYDLPANTELTFNYNLFCIGEDKKICHCGAKKCSGYIGVKYKEEVSTKKSGIKKINSKKIKDKKTKPQIKTLKKKTDNRKNLGTQKTITQSI